MNKKTSSEKKNGWQWLLTLIRILQMLVWWNKRKGNTPLTENVAKIVSEPASATSGPQSSTLSSKSQPSCSQPSESRASETPPAPRQGGDGQNVSGVAVGTGGADDGVNGQVRPFIKNPARSAAGIQAIVDDLGSPLKGGRGGLRKINYLVLHCSDTRPDQDFTIEKLKACHKARGFGDYPGYHVYVRRDGSIYYCRPVRLKGCHVKGHNSDSIGVCYEGGRRGAVAWCERSGAGHPPPLGGTGGSYEDNRTQEQKEALREVFAVLHDCFPDARIVGHNEFGVPKACPCLSKESMEAFRQEIIHWRELKVTLTVRCWAAGYIK